MMTRTIGLGALLLPLLLQACGGDSTSAPVPSRLVVSPSTASMDALGVSQQFTARLEDKKGSELTGSTVTWSSSSPDVASVTATGLATGIKPGSTSIRATAGGLTTSATLSVNPVPREIQKTAGDAQVGVMTQPLTVHPQVEVKDANGNPIPEVAVTFSVQSGNGSVAPALVATDAGGRASTTWTLGCSNEPQRLQAFSSGLTVEFTATADLSAPAICQTTVPQGRETHPYSAALVVAGGDPATMVWSLVSGSLPPGLTLQGTGVLGGTPTLAGLYPFTARAQDGQGRSAAAEYSLRVCEAPLSLAPGGTAALNPSGADGCGFFLPAGSNGNRYRFAVLYASTEDEDSLDVSTVTVSLAKAAVPGSPPERAASPSAPFPPPRAFQNPLEGLPASLLAGVEWAHATEAFHRRLRLAERELIRSLGPGARPLPDTRSLLRTAGPGRAPSPDKVSFFNPEEFNSCAVGSPTRAIKIAENDLVVFYQDSAQSVTDPVSATNAQMMLDYYRDYGKQVIDGYFGGTTDLNGDGKIVVLITPRVEEGTAAFVWSGDFFPRTPQPGWGACPGSNQMELVRFSESTINGLASGDYQALATLVHEVKHVSSLYKSIIRGGGLQPLWVEEGMAELAGEMSSRLAWEAAGGPAVGALARSFDAITKENYGVILRMVRSAWYLASQPNAIMVTPLGARSGHSVYGSGWHFHRWLGDAYGGASMRLADSSFFRTLNDSLTASGIGGIQATTGGKGWTTLLEEYAAAVLLNGTGAPQPGTAFATYDFPGIIGALNTRYNYNGEPSGSYPWPVNVSGSQGSGLFSTSSYTGTIGPSGLQLFDLTSDGTGLGLEVKVQATSQPIRIVVVRIQ